MAKSLTNELEGSKIKSAALLAVASRDLDQVPPEFDDLSRFVINAVRAAAKREDNTQASIWLYSDAPVAHGKPHGFKRIMHMQEENGVLEGTTILTGRDALNGVQISNDGLTLEEVIDRASSFNFGGRTAVVWSPTSRVATVYPNGVDEDQNVLRFQVPPSAVDLTQDDICAVLNKSYNDNLKNPSGYTAKLWIKGQLVNTAEDEIERHLRGQMAMYFAAQKRPIRVLRQIPTAAGRTDLVLIQKDVTGKQMLAGLLELKVLRGPLNEDRDATREGLSQGFNYRNEIDIPFATLALFDVNDPPSNDPTPLLNGQSPDHLASVRVRRFALFKSPQAWRDVGAPRAA